MQDRKNFYINGKWTLPIEPRTYKVINPNLVMFVTGVVGRSMGGGRFTKEEILELTRISVQAFNEHIK